MNPGCWLNICFLLTSTVQNFVLSPQSPHAGSSNLTVSLEEKYPKTRRATNDIRGAALCPLLIEYLDHVMGCGCQ